METICTLTRKTALEILIESGNKTEINEAINQKQIALSNALENVEYYISVNNTDFANEEQAMADRLVRSLNVLIPLYLKKGI